MSRIAWLLVACLIGACADHRDKVYAGGEPVVRIVRDTVGWTQPSVKKWEHGMWVTYLPVMKFRYVATPDSVQVSP